MDIFLTLVNEINGNLVPEFRNTSTGGELLDGFHIAEPFSKTTPGTGRTPSAPTLFLQTPYQELLAFQRLSTHNKSE
jgi:hypothetical protein